MSIFNSVEEELWRIFTFYSLHTDPMFPDVWKPANFLRFSKDCQIISAKITPTAVELEITRLARIKQQQDGVDYNPSITIEFKDFMNLLDALSLKVYPRDPPQIALKRLILENVLLLANRRMPNMDLLDVSHLEAQKAVIETFSKSLLCIFKYYLGLADKRRNQLVTAEKMKNKDLTLVTNKDLAYLTTQRNKELNRLKEHVKSQKDLISYKEYIQFCHDFSLKSTSLLTAIQVGEVFLNIVPFNFELSSECGMNFDLFCRAIAHMSVLAYRECESDVTPPNKLKALLLYMWKAVNDSEKTVRMISSTRVNAVTSYAGSLNMFGSGPFSDQFLANWVKDGFKDYTTVNEASEKTQGTVMVKKIVGDTTDNTDNIITTPEESPSVPESADIMGSPVPPKKTVNRAPKAPRTTFELHVEPSSPLMVPDNTVVTLSGAQLAQLLKAKPELTEFLYLEIQNMKLEQPMMQTI